MLYGLRKLVDRVQLTRLIETLLNTEMDSKEMCFTTNLHLRQNAVFKVGNNTTEETTKQRIVRQDYILSPLLFSYTQIKFPIGY